MGCICSHLGVEVSAGREAKTFDTRSFIMSRPRVEEAQTRTQQHLQLKEEGQSVLPRTVQAGYRPFKDKNMRLHFVSFILVSFLCASFL